MDELEHAWLLTGEELLLLLSLTDRRPAVTFALPDAGQVSAGQWTRTAAALCRKGLAQTDAAGLTPAGPAAGLIAAMKDADTVCLAFCRDARYKTQALYSGGAQTVLLEGTYWPGYRLRAWDAAPDRWLERRLGLPFPAAEPPERADRAAAGPPAVPLEDSPSAWGGQPQARTVLDVYRSCRRALRLVWLRGAAGCTVLCQSDAGSRALPDCRAVRNALTGHIWKGEPL